MSTEVVAGGELEAIAREFRGSERFALFLEEPGAVRCSEPALPIFLAALQLVRAAGSAGAEDTSGLVVLLPDDGDARDLAEAASWYLGEDDVGVFTSRGVRHGSGLKPPVHLVGERARALDVASRGGLICVSGLGYAEGMAPSPERTRAVEFKVGAEAPVEQLVATLVEAGYEHVERVEERGQLAVRGGLVDVYPSTGREPIRIDLLGDEVESLRAFSPFTQRTIRALSAATIYPASERRVELGDGEGAPDPSADEAVPGDLVLPFASCDVVWELGAVLKAIEEEGLSAPSTRGSIAASALPDGQSHVFEAQLPALAARGLVEIERQLGSLVNSDLRVIVSFQHRGEAQRQASLLRRTEVHWLAEGAASLPEDAGVYFTISGARKGVVARELRFALIPENRIFRRRRPSAEGRVGRALQSFADLRSGDFVVHEDHGVGLLEGFETKTVSDVTRDYLNVAFKGEDRLYVPHEQIGKISRYVGGGGAAPKLSKLGGKSWQTIKTRARAGAHELAGELLDLYARRQRVEGHKYDTTDELLAQLETSFPFEETPDQALGVDAVKEDMESARPMDRLICGDVGFGKTEIAVRAAMIATVNSKQTLVLAPTTVLAHQHWNTFRDRFRDLPVNVEMVSRFRRPAQIKKSLAAFAKGEIDVLVGTHRLLSRDVIPKQLGLVVVDEEQRFGVAQKELLRQLRNEIDVLAMSATPIPRTLHMSLAGLRDISVIATPPEGRRPIRTHVGEYDEELISQALYRERERGGRSFFLHNRVETIDEAAERLRQLCPDLSFLVGHGQLGERELEDVMMRFVQGEADVLVSTTIIESGLDIPEANTLIVERSDALGLSQLYQLRGRVGRSDVIAHAYLFYPDASELSPEARARLATLVDHTELGSGFAIAMRDLEIRGAGNLLGDEQSGHVAAIGFELYVELLNEAVAELDGTRAIATRPVRVDAAIDAYVPSDYIDVEAMKIDLHRRLTLVQNEEELRELEAATEDRFGPIPEPVGNLFGIQRAKLTIAQIGVDYLVYRGGKATVGKVILGSSELKGLRALADTAVYSSARQEISMRVDSLTEALDLADAILAVLA